MLHHYDEMDKALEERIEQIDEQIAALRKERAEVKTLLTKRFCRFKRLADDYLWGRKPHMESQQLRYMKRFEEDCARLHVVERSTDILY